MEKLGDHLSGCLLYTSTDERVDNLLAEYEAEQKALVTSVSDAESHLSSLEEDLSLIHI